MTNHIEGIRIGDTIMTILQFILLLMAFLGGVIGWVLCKVVYGIG